MSHQKYKECIEECLKCMVACNHCYVSCLDEEHIGMLKECIRLDRECADICEFAAHAMSINSKYVKAICLACADACEACGNECKKHDHAHCQQCAEACFACAKMCREMAA
ncbi:four-helix bundle copper-binding protein [Paenibacillus sp. UMB7766-LJ446]|uniref:four-helix bundle copper-binding protein n=1 Tax=Paenibacillus sp. UMB7766-LJ446 TaxID=3046313 RepID=UPI00254E3C55|nr:four-helix bundle copper-binding protein [Paenibacillus sp. UMB7766-LJ446]MDK8193170.1 four-helix bundle copper-binding protein [Paenibacillus sp. UMB7766-LJ446]